MSRKASEISKFDEDQNFRHVLSVLASRIRYHQAVDYEFRLFFVMLRDLLQDSSLLRALFQAAAHQLYRGESTRGKSILVNNMIAAKYWLELSDRGFDARVVEKGMAEHVLKWRSGSKAAEFRQHYSRNRRAGTYTLKPGKPVPSSIFQDVFGSVQSGMMTRQDVVTEICDALESVGCGDFLPITPEDLAAKEICIAIAAVLNGLEIKHGIDCLGYFDLHNMSDHIRLGLSVYSTKVNAIICIGILQLGENDGWIDDNLIGACTTAGAAGSSTPSMMLVRDKVSRAKLIASPIIVGHYVEADIWSSIPEDPFRGW